MLRIFKNSKKSNSQYIKWTYFTVYICNTAGLTELVVKKEAVVV